MISKIIARSTRLARPNMIRRGGHGPVSYNEPGGHLFGEKVICGFNFDKCVCVCVCVHGLKKRNDSTINNRRRLDESNK